MVIQGVKLATWAPDGKHLREPLQQAYRKSGYRQRLKNSILLLAVPMLLAFPLAAQNTQPVSTPQPYCQIATSLPAIGVTVGPFNSIPLDNRRTGCTSFTLTVEVPTTISALSLVVQTAPDNGSPSCATCTWSTFAAATGSNPNTLTTGWQATFTTGTSAYYAYLRIQLTSRTGTGQVNAKLQSSIAAGSGGGSSGGCVGTALAPCVVAGPNAVGTTPTQNPVLVAGRNGNSSGPVEALNVNAFGGIALAGAVITGADGSTNTPETPSVVDNSTGNFQQEVTLVYPFAFNGSTWDRQFVCTNQVYVNLSASGAAQVIAGSSTLNIRICHIHLSTSAPETISIQTGTGSNCGTGTATIDAYQNTAAFAMDFQPTAALRSGAGNSVCINPSAATTLTGIIVYAGPY